MKPASTLTLALAVLSLLSLTACSPESDRGAEAAPAAALESNTPATYVHSMDGVPKSLDPARASSTYGKTLVVNLYDTLYRYRYLVRPYELAPNLAEALPEFSEDHLTLTIRLKRGVTFIDDPAFPDGKGREVTAGDVVYSILRQFDPATQAPGAYLWRGRIEGLDAWKEAGADYDNPPSGLWALDDHTLQIRLTQPYAQIVHSLAQGYAAIVPREAVDYHGEGLGTHAVGSGPFRLVEFDRTRVVLERNPGFRAEPISLEEEGFDPERDGGLGLERIDGRAPPFLDRLEVEFITEDAARWNAFFAGETQFLKLPVAQFGQVLASRDPIQLQPDMAERFHVHAAPEAGFVYTSFNMADPAIGDHPDPEQDARNKALRCAIIKAFDWPRRNRQFFGDLAEVFPGVIPPVAPEYDPYLEGTSITHDPEGARALLAEHGWNADNLPVLEWGFPSSVTERQLFEQFRGFLTEVGYPQEKIQPLVYPSFGDYLRAFTNREVMLVTTGWTLDYPDAQNTLQLFFGPNASPGANNGNFDDETFNALYREAEPLEPSPERTALYHAMNRRVVEECAAISGLNRKLLLLWSRDLAMRPDRAFVGGYFFRFVDQASNDTP